MVELVLVVDPSNHGNVIVWTRRYFLHFPRREILSKILRLFFFSARKRISHPRARIYRFRIIKFKKLRKVKSLFRLHRRTRTRRVRFLPPISEGISLFLWVWNLSSYTFNLFSRGFKKILSARVEWPRSAFLRHVASKLRRPSSCKVSPDRITIFRQSNRIDSSPAPYLAAEAPSNRPTPLQDPNL